MISIIFGFIMLSVKQCIVTVTSILLVDVHALTVIHLAHAIMTELSKILKDNCWKMFLLNITYAFSYNDFTDAFRSSSFEQSPADFGRLPRCINF